MPLPRRDWLQFLFNGGKGIRTSQLDGPYVKDVTDHGTVVAQDADGNEVQKQLTELPIPGNRSAFAFRSRPTLSLPTDRNSSTSIGPSGNGYRVTLLDAHEVAGPIFAEVDFFTIWEGFIAFELSQSLRAVFRLHTTHAFGANFAKTFDHVRGVAVDAPAGVRQTLTMAAFNSISQLRTGSYTPPGGSAINITAEDLAGPSKITYILELQVTARKGTNRTSGTLRHLHFDRVKTTSFQLRQALVTETGGGEDGAGVDQAARDAAAAAQATANAAVVNPGSSGRRTAAALTWLGSAIGWYGWVPSVPQAYRLLVGRAGDGDATWLPRGTSGRVLTETSTGPQWRAAAGGSGADSTARAAAAAAQASADAAKDEADHNRDGVDRLTAATADLHAGTASTGWVNATAAAQGGFVLLDAEATETSLRALANNRFVRSASSGITGKWIAFRIPAGSRSQQIRVNYNSGRQAWGVNTYTYTGESSDGNWHYYRDSHDALAGAVTSVQLEVTGDVTHLGTSSFAGQLTGSIKAGLVGLQALAASIQGRLLPTLPNTGARANLIPKFDGDTLKWLSDASGGGGGGTTLTPTQVGDQAFSNPPSDLTASEKAAVLTAIGAGSGDAPGLALVFEGAAGDGDSGESRVGAIVIESGAEVAYYIKATIGNTSGTNVVRGDTWHNARTGSPVTTLAGVAFYSNDDGHALIRKSTTQEAELVIFKVEDRKALQELSGPHVDATARSAAAAATTTANAALPKSGGTLTGALTLAGAPTSNLHAATKKYVDDNAGGGGGGDGAAAEESLRAELADVASLSKGSFAHLTLATPDINEGNLTVTGNRIVVTTPGRYLAVGHLQGVAPTNQANGSNRVLLCVRLGVRASGAGSTTARETEGQSYARKQFGTGGVEFSFLSSRVVELLDLDAGDAVEVQGQAIVQNAIDTCRIDGSASALTLTRVGVLQGPKGEKGDPGSGTADQTARDAATANSAEIRKLEEADTRLEERAEAAERLATEVRTSRGVVVTAIPGTGAGAPANVFLTERQNTPIAIPATSRWPATNRAGSAQRRYPPGEYKLVTAPTADRITVELGRVQVGSPTYFGWMPTRRTMFRNITLPAPLGEIVFTPLGVGCGGVLIADHPTDPNEDVVGMLVEESLHKAWFGSVDTGLPNADLSGSNALQMRVTDSAGTTRNTRCVPGLSVGYWNGVAYREYIATGATTSVFRTPYQSGAGTTDADKVKRTVTIGLWYPRLNNGAGAYLSWGAEAKGYVKVDPETAIHGQKVPAISAQAHEIRFLTKTAYDALTDKDDNTLYFTR